MAYSKAILSGSRLEYWNYERTPPQRFNRSNAKRGQYRKDARRRADNARRTRENFKRLVAANLTRDSNPALLTLTVYRGLSTATAFLYLRELFRTLRDVRNWNIRHISVVEYQKRGTIHFHCLVWGLPDEIICTHKRGTSHALCRNRGKCERTTRNIQRLWSAGYVDCIETDGHPKLAGYLAKYMSKAMSDIRLGGEKAYSASRNILRPMQVGSGAIDNEIKDLLGIGLNDTPTHVHKFQTAWLGQCTYQAFQKEAK